MKQFKESFLKSESFINNKRKPEFSNLLKVLNNEKPDRPTLFEFFLNEGLEKELTRNIIYDEKDPYFYIKRRIDTFRITGYDYATIHGSDFRFPTNRHERKQGQASVSLNSGTIIYDRESFEKYQWPDPEVFDYSRLETLAEYLPAGMKFIIAGADGVLENVANLVGYENLCYMVIDEPELVQDIFNAVGSRFVKYYEMCARYESVGAVISNDDWGFNSQTMLSISDMRKYVIPWHKRIVQAVHNIGKPIILHSCGKLDLVMDDIIEEIKYDAKHSYEDKIRPVEEAYEKYGRRITTLGGLDVDFICRSTPEQIFERACLMLDKAKFMGGYALGSGNTIPYYVPNENYYAMIAAAVLL